MEGPAVGTVTAGAAAVMRRPDLWTTALRQALRLAARGWWRRPPFLPLPDRAYYRFRLQTQYGDPAHEPDPADLVAYLEWCRDFGRTVSRSDR